MQRITAYRIEVVRAPRVNELGNRLALELPAYDAEAYEWHADPVSIELKTGVRIAETGPGHFRLFFRRDPYGQDVSAALTLGWCRLVEGEPTTTSGLAPGVAGLQAEQAPEE